ncbi:MAG TPA: 30S ribosomal protein S6 [Candidatus Binatia bacterium]
MALYETLFVVHPERGTRMKEFIERFKKVVEGQEGAVAHVDEWGLRDLAYRIDKQTKGFYTLLRYSSSARAVEELERNLRLTDGVLRYLTVRADEETQSQPAVKSQPEEHRVAAEDAAAKPEPQT